MHNISRRTFLKSGALAAAGLTIVPSSVMGRSFGFTAPSDKLNIAGGYGDNDAAVTGWNYEDSGNRMRIIPVTDLADNADALVIHLLSDKVKLLSDGRGIKLSFLIGGIEPELLSLRQELTLQYFNTLQVVKS